MEEQDVDVVIEKPSRAKRWMKSVAARMRRKETKEALDAHSFKEDKEARERLQAKRRLEKEQKKAKRKLLSTSQPALNPKEGSYNS